jgi:hypothetical protein
MRVFHYISFIAGFILKLSLYHKKLRKILPIFQKMQEVKKINRPKIKTLKHIPPKKLKYRSGDTVFYILYFISTNTEQISYVKITDAHAKNSCKDN